MQKALIICYYWPPAGGPGVQRWLKFVKYLRDFDIEPVIYVPENPNYPILDKTLEKEIPAQLNVYKHKIFEPYGISKLFWKGETKQISRGIIKAKNQSLSEKALLWIRGNLFIPDARKYWVKPSVEFLSGIIQKEGIKTIITTGPPHSVHLIGLNLKNKFDIKWLADFRDPWTSIGYHKKLRLTAIARKKHKKLERLVLNTADKILVTSNTTKKEFTALTDKPIVTITNGHDLNVNEVVSLDDKFTLSHIGSLLTGRNPKNLWKVLAELVQSNESFRASFQLKLVGVVSTDVLDTIYNHGLKEYVTLVDYLTHDEAIRFLRKSQVLLLVEINSEETKGIIPGKLFEYMAVGRPILGVGPQDWEAARIIKESNCGAAFDYTEDSELKALLLKWFATYTAEELTIVPNGVDQYSRRELTKQLAAELQWE